MAKLHFLAIIAIAASCSPTVRPPAGEEESAQAMASAACQSHADCDAGSKCRVVDVPMGPGIKAIYVDDDAAVARSATAELAASRLRPEKAAPPQCDGECGPYTGDLTIRRTAPVTRCMAEARAAELAVEEGAIE